ncbi:MAG TPA: FadR family transcriptional regulator [Sphaerochaeta sp.]|jgi:DNA-binding FadR family transcriptional regulator|nr:FadR family transcriptional regulator [Sphaerochaeta sp.]
MKNLKSKKLYLQVYDELRHYILKNNLKPGDKIPTEMELSQALGVSRNVLREAVKTLEILGVVSSKPGVGMVVNAFSPSSLSTCMFLNLIDDKGDLFRQSQEVRKVLEIGFAQQCFDSITEDQITRMEDCVTAMESFEEYEDFYDSDAYFHRCMYENLDNKMLIAYLDSAWECDRSFRAKVIEDKALRIKKHRDISIALREKDYEAFMASLIFHFSYKYKINPPETKE